MGFAEGFLGSFKVDLSNDVASRMNDEQYRRAKFENDQAQASAWNARAQEARDMFGEMSDEYAYAVGKMNDYIDNGITFKGVKTRADVEQMNADAIKQQDERFFGLGKYVDKVSPFAEEVVEVGLPEGGPEDKFIMLETPTGEITYKPMSSAAQQHRLLGSMVNSEEFMQAKEDKFKNVQAFNLTGIRNQIVGEDGKTRFAKMNPDGTVTNVALTREEYKQDPTLQGIPFGFNTKREEARATEELRREGVEADIAARERGMLASQERRLGEAQAESDIILARQKEMARFTSDMNKLAGKGTLAEAGKERRARRREWVDAAEGLFGPGVAPDTIDKLAGGMWQGINATMTEATRMFQEGDEDGAADLTGRLVEGLQAQNIDDSVIAYVRDAILNMQEGAVEERGIPFFKERVLLPGAYTGPAGLGLRGAGETRTVDEEDQD